MTGAFVFFQFGTFINVVNADLERKTTQSLVASKGRIMKRILFVVAAAAVTTILSIGSGTSEAKGKPKVLPKPQPQTKKVAIRVVIGGHNHQHHGGHHFQPRCLTRDYCGFRSTCYLPAYRCNLVYDPITRTWYFYSPLLGQYVPVALIAQYAPLAGGVGTLPPGAVPGFPGAVPVPPPAIPPVPPAGTPTLPPGAVPTPPPAEPAEPDAPEAPDNP